MDKTAFKEIENSAKINLEKTNELCPVCGFGTIYKTEWNFYCVIKNNKIILNGERYYVECSLESPGTKRPSPPKGPPLSWRSHC